MVRRAILQIGTEKTGSTSLQSFLATNRERLAERGFIYPRFCGDLNHTGLAAYAMSEDRPDPIKLPFGGTSPDAVPGMRSRLRKLATAELNGSQTAIFCSEHCHSRLRSPDEVRRLKDLLYEFFDEVRVSVYLRRQDRVALSLYSTKLKSGGTPDTVLPLPGTDEGYYNYERFLELWENVFGHDAMSVRLYERNLLHRGNVIDDFLRVWDIGAPEDFSSVVNENSAITLQAQGFLKAINPVLPSVAGDGEDKLRGGVVSTLERAFSGRGAQPARDVARAFYDFYAASNTAVAARYFPHRAVLFDEGFSGYPEQADATDVDVAATAHVAAHLLQAAQDRLGQLEAEIGIRDAQILWRDGKSDGAVATLQTAVVRRPNYAGLHRTLGEFLLRLDRPAESAHAAAMACDLVPDNWEYWHFLGIAEAAAGEVADAVEAQLRALELRPDHPGIEECLEACRARLNQKRSNTL